MASTFNSGDIPRPDITGIAATSMMLSFDNSKLLVGSNVNAGFVKVYKYTESSNTWSTETTINGNSNDNMGNSVSFSWDGDIIAAGAPGNNKVYLYKDTSSSSNWGSYDYDTISGTGSSLFGWSVSLSCDIGNHVAVGAPGENKVYVYQKSGTAFNTWSSVYTRTWSTSDFYNTIYESSGLQAQNAGTSSLIYLRVPHSVASVRFGHSVHFSGFGEFLAVGAPGSHVGTLNASDVTYVGGGSPSVFRCYRDVSPYDARNNSSTSRAHRQLGHVMCFKTSRSDLSWDTSTHGSSIISQHGDTIEGYTEDDTDHMPASYEPSHAFGFPAAGACVQIALDGSRLAVGSPYYSMAGKYSGMENGRIDGYNITGTNTWAKAPGSTLGSARHHMGKQFCLDYKGNRMGVSTRKGSGGTGSVFTFDFSGLGWYEVIPGINWLGNNALDCASMVNGQLLASGHKGDNRIRFFHFTLTKMFTGNEIVSGYMTADTIKVGSNNSSSVTDPSTTNALRKMITFGGTYFDNTYDATEIENRAYYYDATNADIHQQGWSEFLFRKKTNSDAYDMIRFKSNEFRIDNYMPGDGDYDHNPRLTMDVVGNFKLNAEMTFSHERGQANVQALLDVEGDSLTRRRACVGWTGGNNTLGKEKMPFNILYDTRSALVKDGNNSVGLVSNVCVWNRGVGGGATRWNTKGPITGTINYHETEGAISLNTTSSYSLNTGQDGTIYGDSNDSGKGGFKLSFWIKLQNDHNTYSTKTLIGMGDLSTSGVTGCRVQITSDRFQLNFGQYQIRTTSAYTFTKDKWYHLHIISDPVERAGIAHTYLRVNDVIQSRTTTGTVADKGSNYSKKFYVGSSISSDSATNIYIGNIAFYPNKNASYYGSPDTASSTDLYNWGPPQQKLAVGGDAYVKSRLGINNFTPHYPLDIDGDINISSGSSFRINGVAQSFGGGSGGSSVWSTSGSDVYRSSGKVGIGTSSPGYVLDVNGDINMSTGSSFRINGVVQTFGGGGGSSAWTTSGSDVYRSSGKVGIGTSSPSAPLHLTASGGSNPGTNGLYVYNTSNFSGQDAIVTCRVAGSNAGDPYISFDVSGEAGWSWGMDNSDTNKMKLATNWDSLSNNTKMTIDRSGNVGIGTSSPSGPLHIYESTGTNRSATSGTLLLEHGNSGGSSCIVFPSARSSDDYGYIQYEDSTFSGDQKSRLIIGTENEGSGNYEDNVILAPSGKVGIGTNSPAYLLHVNGDINIAGGSSFRIGGVAQTFGGGGGSSAWTTSGSDVYRGSGKVGIGTSSPSRYLDVAGSYATDGGILIQNGDSMAGSGSGPQITFGWNGTKTFQHFIRTRHNSSANNNAIDFYVCDQTENNTLTSGVTHNLSLEAGKVGIGTIYPKARLHVKREGSSGESNVYIQSYSDGTGDQAALFLGTPHHNSTTSQPKCAIIADTIGWSRADLHFCVETTANNGSAYRASTGNSRMMIDGQTGYVGIGTTNPTKAMFVVNGTGNSTNLGTYGWLNQSGGTNQASGSTYYSIHANNRIAGSEFNAHSDSRIKKNVVDINDSSALDKLRLLEPKIYNYIDEKQRGTSNVYGFIAQEVSNVLPYAVTVGEGDIPNILTNSNVSVTSDSNVLELHLDTAVEGLTLSNTSNINITTDKDKYLTVPVLSFSGSNVITIQNNQYFSNVTSAYIHGEQVSNFHNLNKDAIWAVSTSALQEVDRQLQAEKTKVATLETQVADLISRITALENA